MSSWCCRLHPHPGGGKPGSTGRCLVQLISSLNHDFTQVNQRQLQSSKPNIPLFPIPKRHPLSPPNSKEFQNHKRLVIRVWGMLLSGLCWKISWKQRNQSNKLSSFENLSQTKKKKHITTFFPMLLIPKKILQISQCSVFYLQQNYESSSLMIDPKIWPKPHKPQSSFTLTTLHHLQHQPPPLPQHTWEFLARPSAPDASGRVPDDVSRTTTSWRPVPTSRSCRAMHG